MKEALTKEMLIYAFQKLGIQAGDTVFVHSDLRGLGIPDKMQTREQILQFYFDAFLCTLKEVGTLAVPAYYYEYARFGVPFDVDLSPVSSELGSFSEWVNSHPQRIRSCNPLQSIAAVGKQARQLIPEDSLSGYGINSPWHRLRQLGGKIIFLGAAFQSMTFVHHIEQQHGVPHLYCKIYPYPILKSQKRLPGQAISSVRYLDYSIEYDLHAFQQELKKQAALTTYELNSIPLHLVEAEAAFQIGIACLSRNPYFFLKHPPKFVPGKIPTDGITGTPL